MTLVQLDELIRKYLSTGVAMVVVLVGPATAPSVDSARPDSSAATHSTSAPTTGHKSDPTAASDRSLDASGGSSPGRQPKRGSATHGAKPTAASAAAAAAAEPTASAAAAEPTPDAASESPEPARSTADKASTPTAGAEADAGPTAASPTGDGPTGDEGKAAAVTYGWGTPNREDDFTESLSGWGLYDGPGHAGTRSPGAAIVADGVLTIHGDAKGTTEGMAWEHGKGQKYGRWEGRVRASAGDPSYNPLLLLWPDAEDFPQGGELDFMEMTDHTRQSTDAYLHHGKDNAQEHGLVKIDATHWHNWAVEWTPKGVTTYVDGKPWWHTDDTAALPPGPMHLCVQLDWFPQTAAGAVKPSQMQVDWMRQYPLDQASPTSAPLPDKSVMHDVIRHTFGW